MGRTPNAKMNRPNQAGAEDGGIPLVFHAGRPCPAASDAHCYRDMKLHSILFGWSDPDQALRVAAGIPGKRASDGLRPSGHYLPEVRSLPDKVPNLGASIRGRIRIGGYG